MNKYQWNFIDGTKGEISLTEDLEDRIIKSSKGKPIQSAVIPIREIESAVVHIMRYCHEQGVDLKQRNFLDILPPGKIDMDSADIERLKQYLSVPLMQGLGTISKMEDIMVVKGYPYNNIGDGRVFFESADVPELVEGIVRSLDCEKTRGPYEQSVRTIQQYQKLLHKGFFR